MCCVLRCCIKCFLMGLNGFVATIGIILLILFGIFRWGASLLVGFLVNLLNQYFPSSQYPFTSNIDANSISQYIQTYLYPAAYYCLVVGIVLLVIGGIGYVAACCLCCVFVYIYLAILLVVLLAFGASVAAFVATQDQRIAEVKSSIAVQMGNSYREFWQIVAGQFDVLALLTNFMQGYLNCCGMSNYLDFSNSSNWNHTWVYTNATGTTISTKSVIPSTCCPVNINNLGAQNYFLPTDLSCPVSVNPNSSFAATGCWDKYWNQYVSPYLWVQWIIYGIVALIIIGPGILCWILYKLEDVPVP